MSDSRDSIHEMIRSQKSSSRTTLILFLLIIIGVVIYGSVTNSGSIEMAIDNKALGVAGPDNSVTIIMLEDIADVALVEEFEVGEAVEAVESGQNWMGTYRNDLLGEYAICAYQKCATVIVVTSMDDSVFVFNCSTASQTEAYYEDLVEAAANVS